MKQRGRLALLAAVVFACALLLGALAQGDMAFEQPLLEAYVGDRLDLAATLTGVLRGAQIRYESANPSVVQVDESGQAQVLSQGRTRITAADQHGNTAQMYVRAANAKPERRALLLSEQRYDDGRVRTGAVNTVQGLSDMLGALRYRSGTPFEITVRVDSTREDVLRAIESTFAKAEPDDLSLLYISCHGEMQNGEPVLLLHDGSGISVRRLEEMLRDVQGKVVVLIDCCASGAFIGSAASPLFAKEAAETFDNSALLNGKYMVLVSCGAEEDSYRISDTGENNESDMSTVFARAVCEGLGWDLDRDRSVSLRADSNRDGVVTFTELWLYARRRVYYHLSGTGVTQTVMSWPEIDESELFARQFSS